MPTQLSLFDAPIRAEIPLEEFFEAYYECRSNKRWSTNAMRFEMNYEQELLQLCREVNEGTYRVGRSIAFIVERPVVREIFAADFRDRIIHHLLIRKLNPLFEKVFINDSYACRVGKGTLYGIRRVERFVRQCSQNYTKECYILKLDIQAFFLNINRQMLWQKLSRFVADNYKGDDIEIVQEITQKIILNNPAEGCFRRCSEKQWKKLPSHKSLFHAPDDCGIPIGNLTSQVFANFFMNEFDHFVKHTLGIRYYGRYVDDFVCIHSDVDVLKRLIPQVATFLHERLGLQLHPKKIYLQHYTKGVQYLGAVVKPYRNYISSRTMGNFYSALTRFNNLSKCKVIQSSDKVEFLCCMNSYLGFMRHYSSYRYRVRIVSRLSAQWWACVATTNQCQKFIISEYDGYTPII